jgi:hypothetical protein
MENLFFLVLTHHSMITLQHKNLIQFSLGLVVLALLVGTTACNRSPNETWHCYDRENNPVEGVVVICRYSLANSGKTAVNCRVSDATGRLDLDLDDDTPVGLIRGFNCIYSPALHNGDVGLGERWREGKQVPDVAVYFDELNNNIYLKSAAEDPVIWHAALVEFIGSYTMSRGFNNGGIKLNKELSTIVSQERTLFLKKYGEQQVPPDYLENGSFRRYRDFRDLVHQKDVILKFKDITLPFPNP